jgi:uncharacterized protein
MKLAILETQTTWYSQGLQFSCTQCGNCCSGSAGFVWITMEEIVRLAQHLALSPHEVIDRYCRKVGEQFSLKEQRGAAGLYDCIFLRDEPAPKGDGVSHTRRVCSIYPLRPLQCRTWPFWSGNLQSRQTWTETAVRCHGINRGRLFSAEEIDSLKDASDWPQTPPSSHV